MPASVRTLPVHGCSVVLLDWCARVCIMPDGESDQEEGGYRRVAPYYLDRLPDVPAPRIMVMSRRNRDVISRNPRGTQSLRTSALDA